MLVIQFLRSNLFWDEVAHGLVALPFAYYLYRKTGEKIVFFLVMVLTYVIDADHLIDYFAYYGFRFSVSDFFGLDYFRETGRAFVLFHAWEWLAVLLVLVKKYGINGKSGIILAAYTPHLLYDAVGVGSFLFYSITYRFANGFVLP